MTETVKRPHQAKDAIEAIDILARCGDIEYEGYREAIAEEWGMRVSKLDILVAKRFRELNPEPEAQQGWNVEPAADAVDGAALFHEVEAVITKHVVLPKGAAAAIALWGGHTYTFDIASHTPLLAILSPEPECGKTITMKVLLRLCKNPLPTTNISPAAIYYAITECDFPVLLMDEMDSQPDGGEACRNILNSGHEREFAFVMRTEEVGGERQLVKFSTFTPKVVGNIGKLKPTLMSRAIIIWLRRKMPEETVADMEENQPYLMSLAPKLLRWAADNMGLLKGTKPNLPSSLANRGADNWRELFRIAQVLGEGWPERLAASVAALVGARKDDNATIGSMLLEDIRTIFEQSGDDVLPSAKIVDSLALLEDRPWPEWKNGKPITQNALARLLKPFEVTTGDHKLNHGKNLKGYAVGDFKDVFHRYIRSTPKITAPTAPTATPLQNGYGKPQNSATGADGALGAVAGNHAAGSRMVMEQMPDIPPNLRRSPGYRPLDDDEFPPVGRKH